CWIWFIAGRLLSELAPTDLRRDGTAAFGRQRLRIDARTQALVALLRHGLRQGLAEPLEAEGLALTLVGRALGRRTAHTPGGSPGRQRLAGPAKMELASDPAPRWTPAERASAAGPSPVSPTQVFQLVEGIPLYRYQLRLRLARALELLPQCQDLTSLSLDLGFYSHSHFTSAFAKAYGYSPSKFRQVASHR